MPWNRSLIGTLSYTEIHTYIHSGLLSGTVWRISLTSILLTEENHLKPYQLPLLFILAVYYCHGINSSSQLSHPHKIKIMKLMHLSCLDLQGVWVGRQWCCPALTCLCDLLWPHEPHCHTLSSLVNTLRLRVISHGWCCGVRQTVQYTVYTLLLLS